MKILEPEIRAEREFLQACHAELDRMRAEIKTAIATGMGEGDAVDDKYFNHVLRQFRIEIAEELADIDDAPLFFGRLDYPPGEVYEAARGSHTRSPEHDLVYLGRRGIRDDDGEPLVIDWRAPLARAFYEADHDHPMGVRVRRRYGFDQAGVLSAYEDEPLDRPGSAENRLLTAEIERPRQGPMRDIVATIQPDQMRLVRAPVDRTICIQGAPGTGKTAVGLHRLAYLLYTERVRLQKAGGVAVIGPNRSFLAYIAGVLPALGEVAVSQATIDELTGAGQSAEYVDDPRTARIKGDVRMAEVVRRHVWARIRPVDRTLEVKYQHRTWRLYPEDIAEELTEILSRGADYSAGRELLAQRLAHRVLREMERSGGTSATLHQLRRNAAINKAVRDMWPTVEPARLVYDLLTDNALLAEAADGILTAEEQEALIRPRPRSRKAMTWSTLDLALLDEVAALIERPAKLGHVVVDEAQDLSPMHLRAIARRLAGACTVLGDVAQATSPSAVRDWTTVLTHLDRPGGRIEELTHGYRVPADVLDFAARLLPHIAPELRSPTSFRHSADALHLTETDETVAAAVDACAKALQQEGSIGLLAADADIPELHRVLTERGLDHTVLGTEGTARITLAPVSLAKGLEYDTVLVVEPARIVAAEERGLQRLYVALTRAVSTLHVLHADPLPEPLLTQTAAV
ncbi:HelD family protein [Amycolatopsis nivea]|uniref:HelD family protein n=1 Tax=Amycolatopsis nivea TaxID=1644109 RepID=UPI001F0E6583|nr:AAA family ATPase [Amycolatopsis nivea]